MREPSEPALPKPRVLLAEDDPVSACFLGEALHGMGLDVQACGQGGEALRLARTQSFALLLLDVHLPGMGAPGILAALRTDPAAASRDSPVLATSAEVTPVLEKEMHELGCRGLLRKPLRLAELEDAVRCHLHGMPGPLIDDAAGLEASGNQVNLDALRQLFARELDGLASELALLREDPAALRERLHRLRASCGFCGAMALDRACAELGRAMDLHAGPPDPAITRFERALGETRGALHDAAEPGVR